MNILRYIIIFVAWALLSGFSAYAHDSAFFLGGLSMLVAIIVADVVRSCQAKRRVILKRASRT